MLVKVGLGSTTIDRPPDMLEANEHRTAYLRIGNERNIEGGTFFTGNERIGYVIPAKWIGALEIYISIWPEVRVHTDVGVARVDEGLTAIAANRFEPAGRVRTVCPCTVILGATDNVGMRMLRIKRQALELDSRQAVVQAEDLGRDGFQPVLAVS